MITNSKIIIFGGAGFIGSHLIKFLSANGNYIVVADLEEKTNQVKVLVSGGENFEYFACDVRKKIELDFKADYIFNFAAVHREPGHTSDEYFETNIQGAENICGWADQIQCKKIFFTSSISPYGPCEFPKDEAGIVAPETPYGSSKLVAEKIHEAWLKQGESRQLSIVRPGVVFGPSEGGNVTRMIQALKKGYFCYMGNRDTIKAGGYVKELCLSMIWVLEKQALENNNFLLYNFSFNPPYSIKDFVEAISKVGEFKRRVFSIPFPLVYFLSFLVSFLGFCLKKSFSISPVRIKKLVRSNHVLANTLVEMGYTYQYSSLIEAFTDWKKEKPSEW